MTDVRQRLQKAATDRYGQGLKPGVPNPSPLTDAAKLARDALAEIEKLSIIVRRCNVGARRLLELDPCRDNMRDAFQAIIEITQPGLE